MTDDISMSASQETSAGGVSDAVVRRPRRRAASRPAGPPQPSPAPTSTDPSVQPQTDAGMAAAGDGPAPAASGPEPVGETPAVKKTARRRATKKAAGADDGATTAEPIDAGPLPATAAPAPSETSDAPPAKRASSRRRRTPEPTPTEGSAAPEANPADGDATGVTAAVSTVAPLFRAPDPVAPSGTIPAAADDEADDAEDGDDDAAAAAEAATPLSDEAQQSSDETPAPSTRRRRSRGGRNRRRSSDSAATEAATERPSGTSDDSEPASDDGTAEATSPSGATGEPASFEGAASTSSRRRRRRRSGDASSDGSDDTADSADSSGSGSDAGTKASKSSSGKSREPRVASSGITSVEGSTRMEAKKQRRREGREAGRRRVPILSESEFLARRESVDRVMAIRQRKDVTQIAVLEDDVLVEHYVALEEQNSLLGNVYLGRVQNVLPSMEAAFIDIGKGRNAVLYAGEVNWDLVGDRHQARRIENALKPGQQIMVQVSKDPVGHKGARLTSQISLPGRYLVYVPGGGSSGISRKLPDTERSRLKTLLKDILPDESGVIVRTAAEGASEEELRRDVKRLTERWDEIEKLAKSGKPSTLLYAEPDVMLKVVRDLFTEDFTKLVISGNEAWDTVHDYVSYVAPDLVERLERYDGNGDIFGTYRVNEQIAKALERKVWLPSGGSLVIDRTEAMTVVDVNTGKFTGSGGNLESTVTKNNLEAAEEIVRQLRLRDIGGIIVVDFIDMVLENNRDLVLRRLVECLGRDRTRHQVAEVTSLGLVQMTRKRIGTGLVEAFSVPCETCHGRGVVIESEPIAAGAAEQQDHDHSSSSRTTPPSSKASGGRDRRSGKGRAEDGETSKADGNSDRRRGDKQSAAEAAEKLKADQLTAQMHSAAAAATAAIAAALHPEAKLAGVVREGTSDVPSSDSDVDVDGTAPSTEMPTTVEAQLELPQTAATTGDGAADTARSDVAGESSTEASTADAPAAPAKKATARKSVAKKTTTAKTAAKKTTTRKRTTKKAAAAEESEAVGTS